MSDVKHPAILLVVRFMSKLSPDELHSQASLDAYLAGDLRRTIPEAYQIIGTPRVETIQVVEVLRPDRT